MAVFGQVLGGVPRKNFYRALQALFRYLDYQTTAGASQVGTKNGSAVTASEGGAHAFRKTTLTLVDHTVALTDEAGVVAYLGSKVYDMPAGSILFLGAKLDLVVTKSSAGVDDDWAGFVGLGTATASNNATLSSTEQNLCPTTATTATDGESAMKAIATSTEAAKVFANGMDVYLNVLVADADHDVTGTACNLIFNGTIDIFWVPLGSIS